MITAEIKEQFKNKEIHKVIDTVITDVDNFEFSKGVISGHSINVYRIDPIADEGSFLYYENVEDRDNDWDLLMSLVELDN